MKQTVTLALHLLPESIHPPVAIVERWEKRLGETVMAGEAIVTLRAGEERVAVPSSCFGVLAKLCVLPGEGIEAGEPVAVLSGVPSSTVEAESVAGPVVAPPAYIPLGAEEITFCSNDEIALAAHHTGVWQGIPHLHAVAVADITEALRFIERTARGETVSGVAERLTLLPFVLSAVAASLITVPAMNVQLVGEREIHHKKYVHIGVEAQDTMGRLVVPVVHDVNRKSVLMLSREWEELSARTAAQALSATDISGATFTVSEAPQVLYRTPLLHRPLAGHLCFGRPVGNQIYLCLTYDVRIVSNDTAARFLQDVALGMTESRYLFA